MRDVSAVCSVHLRSAVLAPEFSVPIPSVIGKASNVGREAPLAIAGCSPYGTANSN